MKTLNPRIRAADVMPDVLGVAQIAPGGVGTSELNAAAVTSGKIASGQIGATHIFDSSVISGKVASGQIGEAHIFDDSVTSGKVAVGQIGADHIASGQVGAVHIGAAEIKVANVDEYHYTVVVASGGTTCSHGLGVEPTVVHTAIKSGEVVADVTHVATASNLILKAETSGVIVEWQILA